MPSSLFGRFEHGCRQRQANERMTLVMNRDVPLG